MSEYEHSHGKRMLPQVLVATSAVVLVPVAVVWWLRAGEIVTSSWACVVLAVALSVAVSAVGSALWKRLGGSERAVFSELLLWGWIRRMRQERQLANVMAMLGIDRGEALPGASSAPRGELLGALATALDAQDPYTEGHSRRVARHAAMVAREMHLSDEQVERVRAAAAVHDVGKLRIPAALLSKPGPLTEDEFEVVKRHATEGAALVAELGDDELAAIVRHHHERFDGHGYPSRLGGADIPVGARIVAVADTFDAITSMRPYRPAQRHKHALSHLAAVAGTQLDPAAVRAFERYYAGRKGSTLWAGLAVVPQRLFAWMHGNGGAGGNVVFGEVAATTAGMVAVALAAMGTAAAVGVGRAASRDRSSVVVAQRAPAAPVAARHGAAAAVSAAARPGASAGRVSHRPAGTRTYAALKTPPSRPTTHPRSSPPASRGQTGTARTGGGSGGSTHPNRSGAAGATPHRVAVGGSGTTTGSISPPQHAPAPAPAPVGASRPVAVAAPVTPIPVTSSGAVNGPPAGPPAAPATPSVAPAAPAATGAPAPAPNPPPSGPTDKDQCKGGGYQQWGFQNQGQCIASIMAH